MTAACKRVVLVSLLCVLAAFPLFAYAEDLAFGLVVGDAALLWPSPSLSETALGGYEKGEWVKLTGTTDEFYAVVGEDGRAGYMLRTDVERTFERYATIGIVTNPEGTAFLNLRATPSFSARVLGYYYNGVPCLMMDKENGWMHVRVNGLEGYFRAEFLTMSFQVYSEQVATIRTPDMTTMNMREGPGVEYPLVHQFSGGQYVMVLQEGTRWWRVACEGYVGFMDASFLQRGVITPSGDNSEFPRETINLGTTEQPPKQENVEAPDEAIGSAVVSNPKATQVLNLRVEPAKDAAVLGRYANGMQVTVLQQGMEWCRVRNKAGEIGYMMTDYLTLSANLPAVPMARVVHPQQTFVYLRTLPSKSEGSIITKVAHGAVVTVMIPGDVWTKVRYGGQTGYMMTSFLQ